MMTRPEGAIMSSQQGQLCARRTIALFSGIVLAAILVAPGASAGPPAPPGPPTVAAAEAFVQKAEQQLLELWIKAERAGWVQENFITDDTEAIAAEARKDVLAATAELAAEAARFKDLKLPYDVDRKLKLLRTSLPLAAPRDPAKQSELSRIATELQGMYGKGKYCPAGKECMDLNALSRVTAESRDPRELLDVWRGWRTVSPPMRDKYRNLVDLANEGARELGFVDTGAMWRSGYDMPPDAFAAEMDRLWSQVKPLYDSLHCYVRRKLGEKYGPDVVPPGKPIPAHLLGNMWAQTWDNIYDVVQPPIGDPGFNLTEILRKKKVDALGMVRYGEGFFTSLGFAPLPETFFRRSLFTKPADRDVVCHASAWDIDTQDDLRIKMCIEITDEDFRTVHHELGHNFYQRAYKHQPPLYRNSANDGFHEGIGDTIALSITPDYLVKVGLLDKVPEGKGDIGLQMKMALDKIAFLPFGLMIDQWRWKVFSGEIQPGNYNKTWWDLALKYQGVAPPLPRSEADFDPGAKYHIAANVPYARYFLADILQFQFYRALCAQSGYRGPLHQCSFYGNQEVGAKFRKMLEMGQSRPWPEALEALTGERQMDARALLEYFQPLKSWLDEQNRGQVCGW